MEVSSGTPEAFREPSRPNSIPNTFAYVALFAWPAVCIVLFLWLEIEVAAIWSMLGAYLLLPSNLTVYPPLMPPLDKMGIATLSTFVLCSMRSMGRKNLRTSLPIVFFAVAFVVSPILTSLNNSYELSNALGSIPGFYPIDGVKIAARQLITLLPFFVGTRYLSNEKGRILLLKSLPVALLFYSLPMLIELRISPQFHRMLYGYHPHEFIQQVRGDGYRPVVFLSHGLALALLTSLATLASVIAIRAIWTFMRLRPTGVAAYLGMLLVLCKSLGPFMYAIILAPVVLFTRPRTWARVSVIFTLLLCAYPALRWYGLIPVEPVERAANSFSPDRGNSLAFRMKNEIQLLAKANEKPLFGWGTWGRNRVYDTQTGRDLSVTDGGWVIQFGMYGWFGYLALFGLLATSAIRAFNGLDKSASVSNITQAGLTLLLGISVIDQLPNANTLWLPMLIAGSVSAFKEHSKRRIG